MKSKNLLKILATYFRFFGEDIAKYFERYSNEECVRVLNVFLEIVENDFYYVENDKDGHFNIIFNYDVPKTLKRAIDALICLYEVDKRISQGVDEILK